MEFLNLSTAQICLYLGNVLYLSSYLVKGIFLLRILTILGGLSLMGYYFAVSEGPLWEPAIWGIAFFLINLFQLYTLFKSNQPTRLSPEEYHALKLIDEDMDHKLFKRLYSISSPIDLSQQNQIGNKEIALLYQENQQLQMVNTKAYIDPDFSETIKLSIDLRTEGIKWSIRDLKKILRQDPQLKTWWQQQVSKSLQNSNQP